MDLSKIENWQFLEQQDYSNPSLSTLANIFKKDKYTSEDVQDSQIAIQSQIFLGTNPSGIFDLSNEVLNIMVERIFSESRR